MRRVARRGSDAVVRKPRSTQVSCATLDTEIQDVEVLLAAHGSTQKVTNKDNENPLHLATREHKDHDLLDGYECRCHSGIQDWFYTFDGTAKGEHNEFNRRSLQINPVVKIGMGT